MSGCAVCVYDLYGESLEAYKNAVADLRVKLTMVNIPEDQWPKNIQTSSPNTQVVNPASAVQSAFEEMERVLKDKRESEVHTAGKSITTTFKCSSKFDQKCQCSV